MAPDAPQCRVKREGVNVNRKKWLLGSVFVCVLQAHGNGWAQSAGSYPTKPVRFVVPYPPGGTTDIVARGIAAKLSERFGQQVVIDNRGGASTIIGAEAAAKSAPDGYTILLVTATTLSINPQVYPKLPYDAARDFAPITPVVYFPYVIAAHPALPASSVAELIALAKAKPGSIKYSTPGNASTNHLAGALLETMAGIKLLHVPYKGSGPATTAMLGGEVNFVITGIASVLPQWKAGKAKIIAVCSDKRMANWPDIPAVGEAGLKGYEGGTWFGIVTRAGVPRAIVDKLNTEIIASLATPQVKESFAAQGFDVYTATPEEFQRFIKTDMARTAKVIKTAGIKSAE
jgi:tripartite-type tricarboxylate transporter receptor subunit TctC